MKFLKFLFSFGVPFGVGMGVYFGLSYDYMYGLIGGIACGVLFGSAMALVTIKRNNKQQKLKETLNIDIEDIVFDSYANHIAGFFPTEGRLFLTKTTLIFVKNNFERMEFLLNTIRELKTCKHRLNSNALCFFVNDKKEKFIFESVAEEKPVNNLIWVDLIQSEINKVKITTCDSNENV